MSARILPRSRAFHSLKALILVLILPVYILFLVLAVSISYSLASRQIINNAYISMKDTVSQTEQYLRNTLTEIVAQLFHFLNDVNTQQLLREQDSAVIAPNHLRYLVNTDKELDRIYSDYFTTIDSIQAVDIAAVESS